MVPFKQHGFQLQRLAHRGKQTLDRLDGGRDLAALYAADRCLIGARAQRQAALAKAMLSPRLSDQLRCLYRLNDAI